jgi:hypothetical protein
MACLRVGLLQVGLLQVGLQSLQGILRAVQSLQGILRDERSGLVPLDPDAKDLAPPGEWLAGSQQDAALGQQYAV